MPISRRWDPDQHALFVRMVGRVDDAELVRFARELSEDPEVPTGRRELIDLREVEASDVTTEAIRQVAGAFRSQDKTHYETRVALVAASDLGFGLGRMYQAFRDDAPIHLQVFRELEKALAWLGIERVPDDGDDRG